MNMTQQETGAQSREMNPAELAILKAKLLDYYFNQDGKPKKENLLVLRDGKYKAGDVQIAKDILAGLRDQLTAQEVKQLKIIAGEDGVSRVRQMLHALVDSQSKN